MKLLWASIPYEHLLIDQAILHWVGRERGSNKGKVGLPGPRSSTHSTLNMRIWSVERDPLRVKNSAEAVGNGFLGGLRPGHLPRYQVGVRELAQWPESS